MKRFIFGFILISIISGLIYFSYIFFTTPTYKIRFNSMGGTKVENIEIKENFSVKELPITTKKGYDFLGWYVNDNLFDVNLPITKNYTLEAKWQEKSLATYKIKFDSLIPQKISPITLKEGESLDSLPVLEYDGKTFYGWTYQNKVVTKIIATQDMTLVALWHKKS